MTGECASDGGISNAAKECFSNYGARRWLKFHCCDNRQSDSDAIILKEIQGRILLGSGNSITCHLKLNLKLTSLLARHLHTFSISSTN
jgi:hypothetical protein